MRASLTALAFALLLLATATVSGCGLKGDLYLPEAESAPPATEADGDEPQEDGSEPAGP